MTPQEALSWSNNTRALAKEKQYRSVVSELTLQTSFLPNNASLPQRLHHIVTGTNLPPGCKTCGSPVSWDRRYKVYKTYCGNPKCPNIDPDVVEKKRNTTDYTQAVSTRSATNLQKYGHTNFLASEHGKVKAASARTPLSPEHEQGRVAKREKTLMSRVGVPNVSLLKHSKDTRGKLLDKAWLYDQHYTQQKNLTHIADELNVAGGATTIGQYLQKSGLTTQTQPARSYGEKQVSEWLESVGLSIEINNRTLIGPKELNIVIVDHNIAIEYCGLYWHSEQQGKGRQYHRQKQLACAAVGITLLTIFEDEWRDRNEQVKRRILHMVGKADASVYARQTCVVELTTVQKDQFFNANHIQGTGPGSITYGLQCGSDIVAAMSFIRTGNVFTLNRYATSVRVVGGFTKLLSHFKRNNTWTQLVSFADLRWGIGDLYIKTGWKLDSTLPPDYSYSPDGHQRIHKFNYRRANLPRLLKVFDPQLSETKNCDKNNVLRIWDCGKLRFVIAHSPP